jgi:hypothetical protein
MKPRKRHPPRRLVLVDARHIADVFMRLCDAAAASYRHMMAIAAALDVVIDEVRAQRDAVVDEVKAQRAKRRRRNRP